MPKQELQYNKDVRVLNYSRENKAKVKLNAEEIPTLIPQKTLKEWQKDDPNPYYKLQAINYPIKANELNYTESFFESFISKLKKRPIPGSKDGHNLWFGARPDTDFIMVGAKMEKKGNGKGTVYFKNYIPPEGAKGSNEIFIRENKSDMVHFSLVTYPREERYEDKNGNVIIDVVESIRGERNDAVEYDLGAMKQKTNQGLNGQKDRLDNPEEGEKNLDKEELLKKLKNIKDNGDLALSEIANALDFQSNILTDEHEKALKIVNSLNESGITDPIATIKEYQDKMKADEEAVKNAKLDNEFGTDQEGKNLLRQYAGKRVNEVKGKDLEEKIQAIKNDPIAQQLAKDKADYNSETNIIGRIETKKEVEAEEKTTRRTDKV